MSKRLSHLLLLPAFVSACVLLFSNSIFIDLHYADTYRIVNSDIFPITSLISSLMIWICCLGFKSYGKNGKLEKMHIWVSTFLLLFLALSPVLYAQIYGSGLAGTPRAYYDHWTIERYRNPLYFGEIIGVVAFLILAAQVLFVGNLVLGYFRKV